MKIVKLMAAFATLLIIGSVSSAEARPRHHHRHYNPHRHYQHSDRVLGDVATNCDNSGRPCGGPTPNYSENRQAASSEGGVIGGRHAGCPHAFCGCEASIYRFGRIIPDLNLAANWIHKFSRTSPAPRMAAARSGHVMILMRHVAGLDWLVHDGNSGHHLTREHVRSIAGYVIVDPDQPRYASR